MALKISIALLASLVLLDSWAVLTRHPNQRFKQIDEDGYIALDTATGRLCVTVKRYPADKTEPVDTKTDILRNLPTCADLR